MGQDKTAAAAVGPKERTQDLPSWHVDRHSGTSASNWVGSGGFWGPRTKHLDPDCSQQSATLLCRRAGLRGPLLEITITLIQSRF